jgi:hypothetical protein
VTIKEIVRDIGDIFRWFSGKGDHSVKGYVDFYTGGFVTDTLRSWGIELPGEGESFGGSVGNSVKRRLTEELLNLKLIGASVFGNEESRKEYIEKIDILRSNAGVVSESDVDAIWRADSNGASLLPSPVEDAIITSDGRIIHTDPDDSIYAFKGDVSIKPANRMAESSRAGGGVFDGSSQGASNVTNNYVNNSNFNFVDMNPGPKFDLVEV